MVKNLVHGNPIKLIISFCLPLMVGNLFQQFYNMVDTIIVGQFVGKNALSAVGSVGSINFLVIGTILGFCSGFAIPIAQRFGADDHQKMRKYLANIIYLSIIFAVLITTITMLTAKPLLRAMNTPDEIFQDAYIYIIIIFAGLPATILYNMLSSVLRAIGDSKTPLYFLILSSILNIVLDLLFVIVFNMGVMGVAVATIVSQLVSGLLCLVKIKKDFYILHLKKEDLPFDKELSGKLLYSGLPMALQFSITAIGSIMLQAAVNSLGSDIIAAVTIAGRTQLMIILPCETIGLTMATYCGQNLGAKRLDRIKKGVNQSVLLALGYCVIGFAIAYFAGEFVSLLFISKTEVAVLGYVKQFLRFNAFLYPILGVLFVYRNAIQGLGYSIHAMATGVFELFARGAMGFFVVPKFGFIAVCFAHPVAWFAAVIFLIPVYFWVIKKLSKQLTKSEKQEIKTIEQT